MTAQQKSVVTVDGKQFTVWGGPTGVTEVTTAATHTRMGFRRVPLTSKSAKAALAKAQEAAQHTPLRCTAAKCGEFDPLRCAYEAGHTGEHCYVVDHPLRTRSPA